MFFRTNGAARTVGGAGESPAWVRDGLCTAEHAPTLPLLSPLCGSAATHVSARRRATPDRPRGESATPRRDGEGLLVPLRGLERSRPGRRGCRRVGLARR